MKLKTYQAVKKLLNDPKLIELHEYNVRGSSFYRERDAGRIREYVFYLTPQAGTIYVLGELINRLRVVNPHVKIWLSANPDVTIHIW